MQHFAETVLIPIQLVLAMVGMGATLSVRDFANVVRDGRALWLGLFLQWIFVPLFTWGFIAVFSLSKGWAVGLILIAVVPGGAVSNLLTFIGKGNTPLSVALTLVTTAVAIASVPALLSVLAAAYMPEDFSLPTARVVLEITLYLVLPLLAGMIVLRAIPRFAGGLSKWSIRGSVVLVLVIVASSLGTGRIRLAEYGWGPPLMLTLFGSLLAWITPVLCRFARRYDDDTVALSIEVCVRNIGLALLLIHFFFRDQPEQVHVLYACLYYGGMQLVLALPIALRHRRGRSPVLLRAPLPRPLATSAASTVDAALASTPASD